MRGLFKRKGLVPLLRRTLIVAATLAGSTSTVLAASIHAYWIEAWYSAPVAPSYSFGCGQIRSFDDQSVRQVVHLGAGGAELRVRLTNELGRSDLKVSAVHVASSSPSGVTEPGTDRIVTFEGNKNLNIARGAAAVSDPVELRVRRFEDIAVSVYYLGRAAPSGHLHEVLISRPGDHTAGAIGSNVDLEQAPSIVSGVEVESPAPRPVLVAFGDSITEGCDCDMSFHPWDYPDQLAQLLAHGPDGLRWVVINSGISGNQLLHNGAQRVGPSALARFRRDAIEIQGVRVIVLLEGINDIGFHDSVPNKHLVSAKQIIAGYRELIRQAHARGVRVYVGTLTPYEGASYASPAGEIVRHQVNAWIRRGKGFDGVIDFDHVLHDPAHPLPYLNAYQRGDNLHPNVAGYRLMARTVYRELFAHHSR